MARFTKISAKEVIAGIKLQLDIDTTDHDIYFQRLLAEGVRHLDAKSIFKKCEKTLEVEDNQVELPCDFYQLLGLRTNCTPYIYADLPYLYGCGCSENVMVQPYAGGFEIQDGTIFFHVSEGDEITEATLAYWAFNLDDDGLPVIYEDFERGLIDYCCWRFTQKYFKDYPQYMNDQYHKGWTAQKRWVKSKAIKQDFEQNKAQVREWFNAWVGQKNLT